MVDSRKASLLVCCVLLACSDDDNRGDSSTLGSTSEPADSGSDTGSAMSDAASTTGEAGAGGEMAGTSDGSTDACTPSTGAQCGEVPPRSVVAFSDELDTGCEWEIPAPPLGLEVDTELVNVEVNLDCMTNDAVPWVEGSEDCEDDVGWYFDDPEAPINFGLCPVSCERYRYYDSVRLALTYGCPRIPRSF